MRKWRIEVTNARTLPVKIEITRGFETAYWDLDADIAYDRHDVRRARFELTVEPRSKRVFSFVVTTYHGIRQQQIRE